MNRESVVVRIRTRSRSPGSATFPTHKLPLPSFRPLGMGTISISSRTSLVEIVLLRGSSPREGRPLTHRIQWIRSKGAL